MSVTNRTCNVITWNLHSMYSFAIQRITWKHVLKYFSRAAKRGGFQTGGFPDLDLSFLFCPFLSFLGLSRFSGIFPIYGMVRRFSRVVLFLFLGLWRAPTRNSPERVRDTIWPFPKKVGNNRVWKHPGLASLKFLCKSHIGYMRNVFGVLFVMLSGWSADLYLASFLGANLATRNKNRTQPQLFGIVYWEVWSRVVFAISCTSARHPNVTKVVRGLLRTDPPDPTLRIRFALPSSGVHLASIQHWLDIDFLIWPHFDAKLNPEEGRAKRTWGWGAGGLCLINLSQY